MFWIGLTGLNSQTTRSSSTEKIQKVAKLVPLLKMVKLAKTAQLHKAAQYNGVGSTGRNSQTDRYPYTGQDAQSGWIFQLQNSRNGQEDD